MKFDLWALDDSELDPYQFRVFCHIARVGICYQSVHTIAEECHMSSGKASTTRKWLDKNGYIEKAKDPKSGRIGWRIVQFWNSLDEQTQQNYSPDEQKVHSVNGNVHDMNLSNTTEDKQQKTNNTDIGCGAVYDAYHNRIGLLDKNLSDDIGDWYDDVGGVWIIDAIDIAVKANAKSWRYVEGILKNWKTNGRKEISNGSKNGKVVTSQDDNAGGFYV